MTKITEKGFENITICACGIHDTEISGYKNFYSLLSLYEFLVSKNTQVQSIKSLSKEERDTIKKTQHLFYFGKFHKDGVISHIRKVGNGNTIIDLSILTLDIDGTTQERFSKFLEDINGYRYFYLSTFNSGLDENDINKKYRYRVMILFSRPVDSSEYELIARNLLSDWKAKHRDIYFDDKSRSASSGWFFGKTIKPLEHNYNEGETINVDYFISKFSSQVNINSKKSPINNGLNIKSGVCNRNLSSGGVEKLSDKDLEVRIKQVKSLLNLIKNYEYKNWIRVIFGVSDFMCGHDIGIDLLNEWSNKDPNMDTEIKRINYEKLQKLYYSSDSERTEKATIYSVEDSAKCELKEHEDLLLVEGVYKIISSETKTKNPPLLDSYFKTIEKDMFYYIKSNNGKLSKIVYLTTDNFNILLNSYGISVCFDEIKKEVKIKTSIKDDRSHVRHVHSDAAIVDDIRNFIHDLILHNNIKIQGDKKDKIMNCLETIALSNSFNPMRDLINEKPWDKKKRVDELINCIKLDPNLSDDRVTFYKNLIKKSLVGIVSMQYDKEGCGFILILQGKQGIGKTEFIRGLLPYKLSDYVCVGNNIDITTPDGIKNVTKYLIVEFGEIDDLIQSREEGKLKNYFTAKFDSYRPLYKNEFVKYPRRNWNIGTTNETSFLKDLTGNRRYVVIPCYEIDYIKLKDIDLQQVYAELYHLYENCKLTPFLTMEEQIELDKENKEFVQDSSFMESFNAIASVSNENFADYLTVTEIMRRMGWDYQKLSPQTLKNYKSQLMHAGSKKKGHNTFGVIFKEDKKENWVKFANRK